MQWNDNMDEAPRDGEVIVFYDHDIDPYQDPLNPGKLTSYAANAESGDYLSGKGVCVAMYAPQFFESEDVYGNGYWVPECWTASQGGELTDTVVNPIAWMPLPEPPR